MGARGGQSRAPLAPQLVGLGPLHAESLLALAWLLDPDDAIHHRAAAALVDVEPYRVAPLPCVHRGDAGTPACCTDARIGSCVLVLALASKP